MCPVCLCGAYPPGSVGSAYLECRGRANPDHAGSFGTNIPVGVRDLGTEVEGIACLSAKPLAIYHKLDLAFEHVADFLARVDDSSIAAATRRNHMDVPLQQVLAGIGNKTFELNAFSSAQIVRQQDGALACVR